MKKLIGLVFGSLLATGMAFGGVISDNPFLEVEPNNPFPVGNFIGAFPAGPPATLSGGAILIDGTIVPGDVDWYYFTLPGPSIVVADIHMMGHDGDDDLNGANGAFDSQLEFVTAGGAILQADDDGGRGFASSLQVGDGGFNGGLLPAGLYYVGVSSYNDGNILSGFPTLFDGLNSSGTITSGDWDYKLTIGVNTFNVPEPVSMCLLALGGLVLRRRR